MSTSSGYSDYDRLDGEKLAAVRALASRLKPAGEAKLRLEKRTVRRLEASLEAARELCRNGLTDDEALLRLCRDGRMAETCARQALAAGGMRLPAGDGRVRVDAVLSALCGDGDARLTREGLLAALAAFDAAQPLTMAELWAVPEAARIALARAFARVADAIVERGRRCAAAETWMQRPSAKLPRCDAAFIEHALKRSAEDAPPEARVRLEHQLAKRGLTAERVIREAHAARALDQLRLDNLLAAKRLLDELDWQACFRALSRVDRELRADPADVYAHMDDASRAAVRAQTAQIARRLRLTELAVARHAVDAARTRSGREGTVCWWLYDDRGRRALLHRMNRREARLPRLVPDPTGRRCGAAIIALAAALLAILARCVGSPWLWIFCVPLAWTAANALIGKVYSKLFPPARLLKLELDAVPAGCRTLVTMPVLLSDPDRADEICAQLEALGCLETDENIDYLLLGDFADAPREHMESDAAILDRARARVAELNARAGREKYAFLHRSRTLLAADGVWMGRDRKRGALLALNALLAGEDGAEAAFAAEGAACARLKGRFNYVVTLDADTRLLPDTVRELIGAMAHPLNRPEGEQGYAVLQPRMEMLPSACVNGFVRLFSGSGGVNTYPVSVSNLWQDVTGTGMFAGKGIYDVAAFHRRLAGALPEGRILSHDLIEGAIARAGFLGDVAFYDGYPTSLSASLRRLNRWMRGDWQLLPLMLSRKPLPNGRRLGGADKLRMADNLIRSLRAPALLALLLAAAWTANGGALLAVLAVNYLEPLLNLFGSDELKWRRATAQLAILPAMAWCALDAMLRTLWRLWVSGKHLLEWVTAADAERRDDGSAGLRLPGRVAAILLLPGLLVHGWTLAALALAGLFLVGPGWIRDMKSEPVGRRQAASEPQRARLFALARDTWRFFEACVPLEGGALPPDNVQLDPPVGAARRTSPTNIGLYLISCLAACRLGFIGAPEAQTRMANAVNAMERMEKWRGHLFNWHDIDTLAALKPRYVSSVDSGNLAASLLLCAAAPETDEALARRMRALAEGMDFAALYDGERELFVIGMDVDSGRLSQSHYDLLASEARILSFTAMMLGQAPVKHWSHLGRPCAALDAGGALASWSGTMFEYLMPELLMPAPAHTLLGESVRGVIAAQRRLGRRLNRPWGVSESGYYAFDAGLNYQYRAFGLKALALGGEAVEGVVAPYASALAAMAAPEASAENIARMQKLGWTGEFGLYEAADYLRPGADGAPSIVKSHMAHHQGMALCALCNALTGDSLRADFMGQPQARALSLLLEEKPFAGVKLKKTAAAQVRALPTASRHGDVRVARPELRLAETHLLYGGGATALATVDGAVHYARFGVNATRFDGDLLNRRDAACAHLRDADTGVCALLGGGAAFEPGLARYRARLGRVEAEMEICVSPEDGTLVRGVALRNAGERTVRCEVTDVIPVALAGDADWRAHAAFRSLFVESSRPSEDMLLFRVRPRNREERCQALAHMVCAPGAIACETDYEKLTGRMGDTSAPGGIAEALTGTTGTVLNPVSALRASLTLKPGERAQLHFALALLPEGEDAETWLNRYRGEALPDRTARLASARARAMLGFIGLRPGEHHALQKLAALLVDGRLAAQAKSSRRPEAGASREQLWQLGISGDRPLLALFITAADQQDCARAAIRAHSFYRSLGLETDLALVDDGGEGYARPIRDMLSSLLDSLHPGDGVRLIDGEQLAEGQRAALLRAASAVFTGERDFYAQARGLLASIDVPEGRPPRRMDTGASTLKPARRDADNGYGGFLPDGSYAIDVLPEAVPPAPWSNILADASGGMLLTERGGGFIWRENSRSGRLTAFGNDILREGWGMMFYLMETRRGEQLRLLPGDRPDMPFRVTYDATAARYAFETRRLSGEICFCLRGGRPEAVIDVRLENRGLPSGEYSLVGFIDWLMGVDARDAAWLSCWQEDGACLATGASGGAAYFAAADAGARSGPERGAFLGRGGIMRPSGMDMPARDGGWVLELPLRLEKGEACRARFAVGWAEDVPEARGCVRALRQDEAPVAEAALAAWQNRQDQLVIETPDERLNRFANHFLLHQARSSRVLGRTGLYQPGGAYGFRDQLQDMLALMHSEPERVRAHLLRCAAHQFEAGDVTHWWHAPFRGVRTRISDDMLFLPFVTAAYVKHTGDRGILEESVAYLEDVEIPEGSEDVYCEMRPGNASGTLHDHCMRAFRRTDAAGAHGLALMGAGDWNDGMNRVGARGKGESVWLSEFLAVCADSYVEIINEPADVVWLRDLAYRMRGAVEAHGWDGEWYLRAYTDDGVALGSAADRECRIDAISQAWAVLAGLDGARCRSAMDAAWRMLADEETGVIRLLTPPFEGRGVDPGYIRGYPAGVRENGAQYTHGALWLLLALIRMGEGDRAHRALNMLLPYNHADAPEKAEIYRVEPYVMAADVYSQGEHAGRGGWTWYTGAAGWMYSCLLALLGYERRGDRVRLNALLGDWPSAAVTVRFGGSKYRLVCDHRAANITLDGKRIDGKFIQMTDDGKTHEARFPART